LYLDGPARRAQQLLRFFEVHQQSQPRQVRAGFSKSDRESRAVFCCSGRAVLHVCRSERAYAVNDYIIDTYVNDAVRIKLFTHYLIFNDSLSKHLYINRQHDALDYTVREGAKDKTEIGWKSVLIDDYEFTKPLSLKTKIRPKNLAIYILLAIPYQVLICNYYTKSPAGQVRAGSAEYHHPPAPRPRHAFEFISKQLCGSSYAAERLRRLVGGGVDVVAAMVMVMW
jgi:hypothetical protein